MPELKTKATKQSVAKFLAAIPDDTRRADCQAIADMMAKVTKADAVMWGTAIVGFGDWHYTYKSGSGNDWFMVGFSPRKKEISVYLMGGLKDHADLLAKMGKHKIGGGCLYISKLDDIDFAVFTRIIKNTVANLKKK